MVFDCKQNPVMRLEDWKPGGLDTASANLPILQPSELLPILKIKIHKRKINGQSYFEYEHVTGWFSLEPFLSCAAGFEW
jgi:hypothetical protein